MQGEVNGLEDPPKGVLLEHFISGEPYIYRIKREWGISTLEKENFHKISLHILSLLHGILTVQSTEQ